MGLIKYKASEESVYTQTNTSFYTIWLVKKKIDDGSPTPFFLDFFSSQGY